VGLGISIEKIFLPIKKPLGEQLFCKPPKKIPYFRIKFF
jgi:hypothetical protein